MTRRCHHVSRLHWASREIPPQMWLRDCPCPGVQGPFFPTARVTAHCPFGHALHAAGCWPPMAGAADRPCWPGEDGVSIHCLLTFATDGTSVRNTHVVSGKAPSCNVRQPEGAAAAARHRSGRSGMSTVSRATAYARRREAPAGSRNWAFWSPRERVVARFQLPLVAFCAPTAPQVIE